MCIKDIGAPKIPKIVNIFTAPYEVYWRSQHSLLPLLAAQGSGCIGGNRVQGIWFRKVYKSYRTAVPRLPSVSPLSPVSPHLSPDSVGRPLGPRRPWVPLGCRLGVISGNFHVLCKLKQNFTKFFVRTTCCFCKNFVIFVQQEAGTVPGVTGMTDYRKLPAV